MTIPSWLLDAFAAVMLLVAAVSAMRLAAARTWRGSGTGLGPDVDVAHLLMGIAMAGMLTASLTTLPDGAWEAVSAVLTAWFAGRVIADVRRSGAGALAAGHYLPHLIHSSAMIYMFAAITGPMAGSGAGAMGGAGGMSGGPAGMGTFAVPTLGLVFALALTGYAVWDLDQLASPARQRPRARILLSLTPSPARAAALAVPGHAAAAIPGTPAPAADGYGAAGHGAAQTQPGSSALAPQGQSPAEARSLVLAPGVAVGCRIAMGITMAFMLIVMI